MRFRALSRVYRGVKISRSLAARTYHKNKGMREGNLYSFAKHGIEEVLEDLAFTKLGGFDDDAWEGASKEIIEIQQERAGNPGQETILKDYFTPIAESYCNSIQGDYTPEGFIIEMKSELRDDMYEAISEIIEECSNELEDLHAHVYGNYGMSFLYGSTIGRSSRFYNSVRGTNGAKSYQSYLNDLTKNTFSSMYTPNRYFASNQHAFNSWESGAIAKYGFKWNSYEASKARSAANAHKILTARGYRKSSSNISTGGYLSKTDLKGIQNTRNQVKISGKRW